MHSVGDAIVVEGLVKRYGEAMALDGLDLRVPEGSVFGLLGPNGAGKTTTVRILTTLLRPDAGTAAVAGLDVTSNPADVRRRIGMAGQFTALDYTLSGRENLVMFGRLQRLGRRQANRSADRLLGEFGLTEVAGKAVSTYSGGMARRLDLAAALVATPTVLFLDEPSTGLDPQSRANLWEHIRSLRDDHDTTVFLTTHYLDEADALCDRILVIDHGRIVAEGSPSDLKAQVSGDRLEVGVPNEQVSRAAEVAGALPGAHDVSTVDSLVRFRVPRGDTAMPELLRALDSAEIPMTSVQVHRPSLDDVFLTLTGRSLRDAPAA